MNLFEILLSVYGLIVLVLVWRYTVICNRLRAQLLWSRGEKTDFATFVPQILRDALIFPLTIMWHGLKAFIKELE